MYRVELPRTDPELAVALEVVAGTRIDAELADLSRNGAGLRIASERAPHVVPSQNVILHFSDRRTGHYVPIAGHMRSVIVTPTACRYGVRFGLTENLEARLPGHWLPRFNQRVARRIRPNSLVEIYLGRADGKMVQGILRDISWSGMSVMIPARDVSSSLDRLEEVEIRFRLPNVNRDFYLIGRIQRDLLIDDTVCYGISFDPLSTQDFKSQQANLRRYVARCRIESDPKLKTR